MKAKRDGNPLGKIYEVQFANICVGASYIKKRNKIAVEYGFPIKTNSELTWGSLNENRKLRYNALGEPSIHCFRISKVRKNEGYFVDASGNRVSPALVNEWRKDYEPELKVDEIKAIEDPIVREKAIEDFIQRKTGWRAYKIANITHFFIKGIEFEVIHPKKK